MDYSRGINDILDADNVPDLTLLSGDYIRGMRGLDPGYERIISEVCAD